MRNVTISLDDETARWARIEAAKRDMSVSRLIGEMLRSQMKNAGEYERARKSYAERKGAALTPEGTPYPSRDDVHAR